MSGLEERFKKLIINIDGRSNYHTHTYYCDGKNSPEEMVLSAVNLGFRSLGFSGHQYSPQDAHYAMSPENEAKYRSEIEELKDKYRDKINIYLGIERDYCCDATEGFDYIIGSTHHVEKDGIWMNVDESPENQKQGVDDLFSGDYMAFIEAYYDLETDVLNKTKGQIVGHFDLVTVFNKGNRFFDENDLAYIKLAKNSAEKIAENFISSKAANDLGSGFPDELGEAIYKTGLPIFEINTGAMAKNKRDVPYPAPSVLEHLIDMGVPLLLNSDCHDSNYLDYGFSDIVQMFRF